MAFMIPSADYFTEEEAREFRTEEALAAGYDPEEIDGMGLAGWYGRLSAPGYLDCTDWSGPFDKAWKALRDICDTYEVRLDGEPRYDY